MTLFLGGIAFLALGYFAYGRVLEHIVKPSDHATPCMKNPDGVDFVPLPQWKNMLIQLLNIAGVGPVIGVILGIKFGKIALAIIPVGCVFMGAVHDYLAGMMSLRHGGANLPRLVEISLGRRYARVFSQLLVVLLLLVVAVFINVPANLIDKTWLPNIPFFWPAVVLIAGYYIAATLFPVDKIIGRIYPVFGALLIIGSLAIAIALVAAGFARPEILNDCAGFAMFKSQQPLFPCLFVTIACGIISGFHATQSPIVARTMRSEKEGKSTFFGMMILEGVIAMIWAAAALAMYNLEAPLIAEKPDFVLGKIASHFLGAWMGGVTVLAVIILAVTSGDTALRSARLTLAEIFHIDQKPIPRRIATTLPLILIVTALLGWSNTSPKSFNNLWNYFAFGNQIIAATMLMTASVWLLRQGLGLKTLVSLMPGIFMTTVVVAFILWTPGTNGHPWGLVPGGLPLPCSIACGFVVALASAAYACRQGRRNPTDAQP